MTCRSTPWPAAVAAALALFAGALQAGDHGLRAAPLLPAYQEECGTCHAPYPPGLLPAPSWQRVMGTLSRHYGTDASLDAATATQLSSWLAANAGASRRAREAPPQDRVTRSAWFGREHDEVPAATWRSAAVKSPANCGACHTQANQGDFDEHRIRIPR
jgi:hypothetical protein